MFFIKRGKVNQTPFIYAKPKKVKKKKVFKQITREAFLAM